MVKNKETLERIAYSVVLAFIIVNAFLNHDSIYAVISAICGITYTALAGKGNPICYLFGVTGSSFYGLISFQNALWGNLLLYIGYYIPMQTLGFFTWNKHLKKDKREIIKSKLSLKELVIVLSVSLFLIILSTAGLKYFNDSHPVLDSITTVLSIAGMYLTVKRAIEQWLFWMVVNGLSLIMWLNVALSGEKVWSTVIMWAVYFFLSFYFYFEWKKEKLTD